MVDLAVVARTVYQQMRLNPKGVPPAAPLGYLAIRALTSKGLLRVGESRMKLRILEALAKILGRKAPGMRTFGTSLATAAGSSRQGETASSTPILEAWAQHGSSPPW